MVYSLDFCKHAKFVTHIGDMPAIFGVAMNVKNINCFLLKTRHPSKKPVLFPGRSFFILSKIWKKRMKTWP